MLGVLAGALWDVISYNDFYLPRLLWEAISTGSA